jgi:phospholipid/cholesterol/gamma-HCH transport system ATP-binding protein
MNETPQTPPAPASRPLVVLEEVTKRFGDHAVLDRLNLTVWPEQSLVIMGPSGQGKTVLLKHLIGLIEPDEGRVMIDGVDFWAQRAAGRRELRRRFGISFQEGALFDSLSVYENVAFPLRRHTNWSEEQIRDRVHVCLDTVKLPGIERRRTSELSTGMRRRVGFARAIALEPEVLLFDEPTAALDPVMVTVVNDVIADLSKRSTTVLATHDLRTTYAVADRVVLLFHGKLVADAPTREFMNLPIPEVRQFMEGRAHGPLWAGEVLGGS